MRPNHQFIVEEVHDLSAAWSEIEPLLSELHEHHRRLMGHPLLTDWDIRSRRYYASLSPILILIVRQGSAPVAFLNGRIVRDPEVFEEAYGFIDNAYVRPSVRNHGRGHELLARAEEWFTSHGLHEVRLNVVASNDLGIAFWQSNGFSPLSITMSKSLSGASL